MKKILTLSLLSLAAITACAQSFNQKRLDSLFEILAKKDKFMGSIAVAQNGKIIYSNAIGYSDLVSAKKASTLTRYRIGSISKMFTATLIFKAIEEKRLSLDKTVEGYFPQIKNSEKITIGNLLNHRSGIHNFTDDKAYFDYYKLPQTEKAMVDIIAKGGSDFEPDGKAQYSNSNYVLLSYILQKVYKKDYAVILKEKIVKPLGLENTYFGKKTDLQNNESYSYYFKGQWQKEPETDMSVPMGAGAIIATPTDLTTFINALFEGKIISQNSLALMKTLKDGYGMGIFKLPINGNISYGHDGAIDKFQSIISYFPEEKLAVAISSNGVIYKNQSILACAVSSYFNKPFDMPTFEVPAIDPAVLDSYVGKYVSAQMPLKIDITRTDNLLFAQATGQSALPLEASSATVFKYEQAGIVMEFNAENKQMTLKQGGREFLFKKD